MREKRPVGFSTTSDDEDLAGYETLVIQGSAKVQSSIDLMGEHMKEMSANIGFLDGNPGSLADSVVGDTARKMNRDSMKIVAGADDFFRVAEAARTGRVTVSEETVLSVATYCETLTGMVKSCLRFESTVRGRQEDGYFENSGTYLLESMALVRSRVFLAIEAVSRMCGPVEDEQESD